MNIDPRYIERLASELDFQPSMLEKCWRLTVLLSRLIDHPRLVKMLLLRGGTAINFLYADLPRLSIDIDLDYIGDIEQKGMLNDRPFIEDEIRKIVHAEQYRIAALPKSYELTQFILRYSNIHGSNDEIKVELDWINRLPVLAPVKLGSVIHSTFPPFPS